MQHYQIHHGFIELIVGCMFAGKTEELIRRVSVLKRGNRKVLSFKPKFDNRHKNQIIKSHSGGQIKAYEIPLENGIKAIETIIQEYEKKNEKINVLAFDEIQFFAPNFCDFIEQKANQGYQIICAGLDKGYNDELFLTTMRLLSMAEFVSKLMAICVICGSMATKTQRINEKKEPIGPSEVTNVIGGAEVYQARCRKCYKHFNN